MMNVDILAQIYCDDVQECASDSIYTPFRGLLSCYNASIPLMIPCNISCFGSHSCYKREEIFSQEQLYLFELQAMKNYLIQ